MSTLPVVDTSAVPVAATQVVPHYVDGQGWTTQILLVNPTSSAIAGSVQFSNQDGSPASVTIAGQNGAGFAYGIAARSAQNLMTSGESVSAGSVHVVSSTGAAPTPLVIFSYAIPGVTVTEAGVSVTSGTALRMYVESSGATVQSGSIVSGVAIANLSSSLVNATIEIMELDGSTAAPNVAISLPASGQTSKLLSDLFPSLRDPFKGVLRISAPAPGLSVAGLRIHYNERSEPVITTTPPSVETDPPTSMPMVFPHLADGGGFTTQFILFSRTAGQTSSGNLSVFDTNGQPMILGLH
jgi:hypothetical protein